MPESATDESVKNLNQVLLSVMDSYAGRTCFQIRQGRRYQHISYHRFQRYALRLAKTLYDHGVSNGERVAVVAENSLEWMVSFVAIMLAGGVAVPLRSSLAPDTLCKILLDCGARLAILQDESAIRTIAANLTNRRDQHPELQAILAINDQDFERPKNVESVGTILTQAPPLTPEERQEIQQHAQNVSPHALTLIHYLTIESGESIGAIFDHSQSLATWAVMQEWFTFSDDDVAFTLLPWSSPSSLQTALHYFLSGIPNALVNDYESVFDDMQQVSPTVMLDIPYTWERLYEGYMRWISEQPESSQEVFKWAVAKAKEYRLAGPSASAELRQEYARADMTFFSDFRGRIGGRMRRLYSAGASLPQELVEFFEAVGLPMFNVYSLSEAGGFPAVSRPGHSKTSSCGKTAPGFEIKIAEDDEILVRGETVMRRYWQQPERTQEAINPDGWLHSGDLGHFDDDGYLHITGRKRHMMVLSTGRKIAPLAIESQLMASPFITQAAIFGEGKPYVSAMIVPNLEALTEYFQDDGEAVPSTGHPRVKALLDEVIGQINSNLDQWEQIREYNLLDQPLTQDTGELTPSMKISRHVVAERYAAQIEAMYPITIQLDEKEVTQVQVDPEHLRELLEKENILDAWMADAGIEFLFDLARARQIDAPSMVNICDTAASIAQMENEEKPLSTAIIVGDPIRIGRVLPTSQVQLLYHEHIRRMRKTLVTLAKMVDGIVLGYVVDRYGYVRGVVKLEVDLDEPPGFLGPQFRHHAAISEKCEAVVFFVPAGGRQVRVFADGQLVGRYANGDWQPDRVSHVEQIIGELAKRRGNNRAMILRILRCAFQMSEENLGAIWLIGNADEIIKHSDSSEISSFAAIVSINIDDLSDRELITFAKQDGATVIDESGKFSGCMVLLRPDASTNAEIGPGKGARHSSAAKMSAETDCVAITVSQDGPITIYDGGRRVLSL
jgi:long-chain acyl-CoA synthetase